MSALLTAESPRRFLVGCDNNVDEKALAIAFFEPRRADALVISPLAARNATPATHFSFEQLARCFCSLLIGEPASI